MTDVTGPASPVASPVRKTPLQVRPRLLEVLRVEPLGAALRRVVLGGPELVDFRADGPTDHAKVLVPAEPGGHPVLPVLTDGRWCPPDGEGLLMRDYTIRTYTPGSGELVLDMAVHSHGPAGRWAAAAEPGHPLGLLGPKSTKTVPTDRDWYVLAADESGLPAVLNWLERLPQGPDVHVLLEVDGPQAEVALPEREGTSVTWLHRPAGDADATTVPALLPDALAATPFGGPDDGTGWVWAAAEASAVRAMRQVAVARGLDRSTMQMTGYWRRGVAGFDHKSEV